MIIANDNTVLCSYVATVKCNECMLRRIGVCTREYARGNARWELNVEEDDEKEKEKIKSELGRLTTYLSHVKIKSMTLSIFQKYYAAGEVSQSFFLSFTQFWLVGW